MNEGVDGLLRDRSRPPGKTPVPAERVAEIVRLTQEPPPFEATHWTLRAMAKVAGVAASTVQGIWKAHGLSPHRWRQFKLSNDPAFAEKLTESSACTSIRPPKPWSCRSMRNSRSRRSTDRARPADEAGRAGTMTHDYNGMARRHLRSPQCAGWHGHRPEHAAPPPPGVHPLPQPHRAQVPPASPSTRSSTTTPRQEDKVRAWLARHPRFRFHFTPTSCTWLNAVEGFFAKLHRCRLKHGVFHSVVDLQAAINRFVRQYNADDPRPFIWNGLPPFGGPGRL